MSRTATIALALLVLGALLIGVGELLARAIPAELCSAELWGDPANARRCARYLLPTARAGGTQLGAVAILAGVGGLGLALLEPARRAAWLTRIRHACLGLAGVALISFVSGELALRLYFWDGMSFGGHGGPLVRRFERDFVLNSHEGPSRGPRSRGREATRLEARARAGGLDHLGPGVCAGRRRSTRPGSVNTCARATLASRS